VLIYPGIPRIKHEPSPVDWAWLSVTER
jgi:hypothetical protein